MLLLPPDPACPCPPQPPHPPSPLIKGSEPSSLICRGLWQQAKAQQPRAGVAHSFPELQTAILTAPKTRFKSCVTHALLLRRNSCSTSDSRESLPWQRCSIQSGVATGAVQGLSLCAGAAPLVLLPLSLQEKTFFP